MIWGGDVYIKYLIGFFVTYRVDAIYYSIGKIRE